MNIKIVVTGYLLTFIVFLIIDLIWMGVKAKNIYQKYLGGFLSDNVNRPSAVSFSGFKIVKWLIQ